MNLWAAALGDSAVDVATIAARAAEELTPLNQEMDAANLLVSELRDKLLDVACSGGKNPGKWSGKSIGWWLRRNKDRVLGGRRFRSEQGNGEALRWRLEGAKRRTRESGEDDDIPF